jgi:protein CpxP
MRNSNIKLSITAAIFAGSVAFFSVFAHAEGNGMMDPDSEENGMMSSEGMHGMGGMMGMMSEMPEEDRKAMKEACMKMMQSHNSDHMGGGEKDQDA